MPFVTVPARRIEYSHSLYITLQSIPEGRDSSVGIATPYGLDGPGIESRCWRDFSVPVRTVSGAHPASYTKGTGSLLGVKRPGRGLDHPPPHLAPRLKKELRCVRLTTLPPSCAAVMKSGNLNFLEPSGPLQDCNGTSLPFTFYVIDIQTWCNETIQFTNHHALIASKLTPLLNGQTVQSPEALKVKIKQFRYRPGVVPEGSRKLTFLDFMTTAQDCGKVVSLTHRPPFPLGNVPGTHFC